MAEKISAFEGRQSTVKLVTLFCSLQMQGINLWL